MMPLNESSPFQSGKYRLAENPLHRSKYLLAALGPPRVSTFHLLAFWSNCELTTRVLKRTSLLMSNCLSTCLKYSRNSSQPGYFSFQFQFFQHSLIEYS